MNISDRFSALLHTRYLSHIHTSYTDGANTVGEYCVRASESRFEAIVFSEHVRRELSYDFDAYLGDIVDARRSFPGLELWVGAEAKILPDGSLDIPEEILPNIEVLFIACHSFPDDVNVYRTALTRVFRDTKWKEHVRIWAHPGYFFKKRPCTSSHGILSGLVLTARDEGILIEKNLHHDVPSEEILSLLDWSQIITGYDAHSVESLPPV